MIKLNQSLITLKESHGIRNRPAPFISGRCQARASGWTGFHADFVGKLEFCGYPVPSPLAKSTLADPAKPEAS